MAQSLRMQILLPPDIRRVLLLWIGRIGDLLVATPVLNSLRRRFPGAELVLVVGDKGREAAALCPDVDRVLVLRRAASPVANLFLAAELAGRPSDLLIDLNTSFSRASAALTALARAKLKLAFEKSSGNAVFTHRLPAPGEREHMLDRYARLAAALGADYDPSPRVRVPPEALPRARELLAAVPPGPGPRVILFPGNFKKHDNRWPEWKFAELAEKLLAAGGRRLAFLPGPGEEGRVSDIARRLGRPVPVLPPSPLAVTAALLSLVDLLVANVTGISHLAVAVGTPTFCLMSRYTQAVWTPRSGPHWGAVSGSWESCRGIGADAAWTALREALERLPPRAIAPGQQRAV